MPRMVTIDRDLYDCDDCLDEAFMDVGILDSKERIPADRLEAFNRWYKYEYTQAHVKRNNPVRGRSGKDTGQS